MAPYRDVSLEEEEPLTGAEKWSSKFSSNSLPKRLARVTPYWPWIAHGVLLSLSLTFFALSICIRSAKQGVLLDRPPETYCKSIRKSPPPTPSYPSNKDQQRRHWAPSSTKSNALIFPPSPRVPSLERAPKWTRCGITSPTVVCSTHPQPCMMC